MSAAMQELLSILDLEELEHNLYRGRSPKESWQRVFGGQTIAQALVAAQRTVEPDRRVHSLHGYFMLPGDTAVPVVYQVDRIRDGGSFTTRRVRRDPARPGHLHPGGVLPGRRGGARPPDSHARRRAGSRHTDGAGRDPARSLAMRAGAAEALLGAREAAGHAAGRSSNTIPAAKSSRPCSMSGSAPRARFPPIHRCVRPCSPISPT